MKKIFYEKQGRRYVPIAEYNSEWMDSFPKGTHLVVNTDGCTSRKFKIDPAFAPMIAAGGYAERAIADAIVRGSEARPERVALTDAQQAAWEQMKTAFGTDMFYIQYPSAADAVDCGVKAMQDEANKLLSHPAVKQAYDHFMLVAELAKKVEPSED